MRVQERERGSVTPVFLGKLPSEQAHHAQFFKRVRTVQLPVHRRELAVFRLPEGGQDRFERVVWQRAFQMVDVRNRSRLYQHSVVAVQR